MKTLYFLPHFDDEVFVIPKIRKDILSGKSPFFIFFMSSNIRANESVVFLKKLGVKKENIIFIGEKFNALDGVLLNYLPMFYSELSLIFDQISDMEIVCPAYEGGHQDHDAISLLGRALAKRWRAVFLEFFLYHGYGTKGRFYLVASPLPGKLLKKYRYTLTDWLQLLKVPIVYKSQKMSMLGLWPIIILKAIFTPLVLREILPDSFIVDRHVEVPLYERWRRVTQEEFVDKIKGFQEIDSFTKSKD
jgi:hypothetical protein